MPAAPAPNRSQIIGLSIASCTTALGTTVATVICAIQGQDATPIVAIAGYCCAMGIGRRIFHVPETPEPPDTPEDLERRRKERERTSILSMVNTHRISAEQGDQLLRNVEESDLI